MQTYLFIAHTGWWWLDVLVYVVSGGAFLRICYLLLAQSQYYRNVIKPSIDEIREILRES